MGLRIWQTEGVLNIDGDEDIIAKAQGLTEPNPEIFGDKMSAQGLADIYSTVQKNKSDYNVKLYEAAKQKFIETFEKSKEYLSR
jgi:hypothetical protein